MIICTKCQGTGMYMGNGFVMMDCDSCQDEEPQIVKPSLTGVDRKSKSYQKAIKDIMALNSSMTRKEAITLFDKTYEKT